MEPIEAEPGVSFTEERVTQPAAGGSYASGIIAWLMRVSGGAIKDERQAVYTLAGFIGVALLLSLYFFTFGSGSTEAPPPPVMGDTFVPINQTTGL